MGQYNATASTACQKILDTPKHHVCKPTAFELANASTDVVIARLQRVFVPDVSNGVTTVSPNTTETICTLLAAAGNNRSLGADDLQDLRAFGRVQCVCDADIATCDINFRYHLV